MTPVAPSDRTRINDECDFSWQAQYLVMLDNNTCCSAHCEKRFRSDKDQ